MKKLTQYLLHSIKPNVHPQFESTIKKENLATKVQILYNHLATKVQIVYNNFHYIILYYIMLYYVGYKHSILKVEIKKVRGT